MDSTVNVALVGICGYGGSYLNALFDPAPAGHAGDNGSASGSANGNGGANGDDGDGHGHASSNGNGSASGSASGSAGGSSVNGGTRFRVVGVVDPAASRCPRLAELRERGIPVHADLPGLYATTAVHLTMMATPIHLHAAHTCTALAHGSNVLCEKPLGATLDDALRVAAAERLHGLFVAVGYQWSFSRAVQALKRDVIAGVLGKPKRLSTIAMFPRGISYYRRNNWAGRITTEWGERVYDSPLNNATAHYLHNMLYVLGPTREDSATPAWVEAELYRANDIENYDTAALRCMTACGTEVTFYTTHAVRDRIGPLCRFEFERATVEFDAARGGQFVARFADGTVLDYGQPEVDRNEKIWQSIDAVRSGRAVACGARAALAHTMCVTAAQASAQASGQGVRQFPADLRRLGAVAGENMVWVDGLSEALLDCHARAALPAELGHAWARPARRVAAAPAGAELSGRNAVVAPFAAHV